MMNPQAIIAEFSEIITNNSEPDLEEAVYNFFAEQLEKHDLNETNDFFEAILIDFTLEEYAEKPFLQALWDALLLENYICLDVENGKFLKTQKNISSFYLIMGLYIYSQKIDETNLGGDKTQYNLALGIKYHSIHCIFIQIDYLMEKFSLINKTDKQELFNIIFALSQKLVIHLAPGYLLYAKICWMLSDIDSSMASLGYSALYIANKLERYSNDEMHNAFFGVPFEMYGTDQIHILMEKYINTTSLTKEKILKAREIGYSTVEKLIDNNFNLN